MKQIEYDILGRVIFEKEPITETVYEYEYFSNNSRIITITNENNKSNFKTIKKQILVEGEYVDLETKEYGELYSIIKTYEFKNKETYYERTNLKTGKVFKKKTFWKEDKMHFWITEYDGKNKNVGFRMSKEILNKIINNK